MKKIPNPEGMKKIKGPKLTKKEMTQAKIRITTYLDKDIITTLRQLAMDSGGKYQSFLNQILRNTLFGETKGLISRIAHLEKVVFKKQAA